jgi:hypothetical protein
MSYENPSDEVADDYMQALRSLEMNSRYEISNLTVIAKENTEHALAISEAVKTHIKQVGQNISFIILEYLVTSFSCASLTCAAKFLIFTYTSSGFTAEEIARFLCPRFGRQECWHTVHALLWPGTLFDLHGSICFGGQ